MASYGSLAPSGRVFTPPIDSLAGGDPVLLDPVENNSTAVEAARSFERGMYHRQYLRAATDGVWGHTERGCGSMVLVKRDGETVEVRPVLCDTWGCTLCGPRRAAWLKRELKSAQERYGLGFFWTLTIGTESCTPAESDELVTTAWDRLNTRLKRRFGKFSYVWIREHTLAGMAHLHLLVSVEVPQLWLSLNWEDCSGGSYVVKVEPVESERAGDYLAKYCTQQAQDRAKPEYAHLAGRRFFSKSRDIQFAPFRGEPERVEVTDEETGEVCRASHYELLGTPYWVLVRHYGKIGWKPRVQRVQGVPYVVLEWEGSG